MATAPATQHEVVAAAAQQNEDRDQIHVDEEQPLLAKRSPDVRVLGDAGDGMSPMQRAISQTYQSTAHLATLLPTGTVLAFQLLSPIVTNNGRCLASNRAMEGTLVALCALSCFVLSFTDSFRDGKGAVRYGFATLRGLWVIDGGVPLDAQAAAPFRVRFLDLVHAVVTVMVFAAVALFDQNVVSCFYPVPSEDVRQVLTVLPIAIGVVEKNLANSGRTTWPFRSSSFANLVTMGRVFGSGSDR